MQYLYNLWLDVGGGQYAFTDADVSGFEESVALSEPFDDCPFKHPAREKLQELRGGLRPQPPK
eukprot:3617497-Lingulodinium_polyedra.AAC.1